MNGYFHCDLCDKSIKVKSKKKQLISQYHKSLTKSIICEYTVKNPTFLHIEDILKNLLKIIIKNLNFKKYFVNGNYIFQIL